MNCVSSIFLIVPSVLIMNVPRVSLPIILKDILWKMEVLSLFVLKSVLLECILILILMIGLFALSVLQILDVTIVNHKANAKDVKMDFIFQN